MSEEKDEFDYPNIGESIVGMDRYRSLAEAWQELERLKYLRPNVNFVLTDISED